MANQKATITISPDDFVKVSQAAEDIGVHIATIYRWIEKGKIQPLSIAGHVFVSIDDVKTLRENPGRKNTERDTSTPSEV